MTDPLDLKNAQSAFQTFFAAPKESVPTEAPKERVVQRVDMQGQTTEKSVQSLSVDEAEAIVEKSKSFDEVLKELNINYSELFSIIDSFLEKGYYEYKYSIKSFEFALRSKKVHSIDSINDALDASKYTLTQAAGQMLIERSLAATLVYFKLGKSTARMFEHNNQDDDEKVLEFIKSEISAPIYALMVARLQKFELLTGLATRDEAIDRFLAHTQD